MDAVRSHDGSSPAESSSAAQVVEQLIHAYGTLVFHTIYGLAGDWEGSRDLTQDTFLQTLQAIDAARARRVWTFTPKPGSCVSP